MGAGLPIISTLQSLVRTHDRMECIEGVLSGTLSYIFNSFGPEQPFSNVVADAKAAGYTEPDPRDDLSGISESEKFFLLSSMNYTRGILQACRAVDHQVAIEIRVGL